MKEGEYQEMCSKCIGKRNMVIAEGLSYALLTFSFRGLERPTTTKSATK